MSGHTPGPWKIICQVARKMLTNALGTTAELNKLKARIQELESDRVQKLEAFILDTRGELPGPQDFKARAIQAISDVLPRIEDFAKSIVRGTGTAANYEYQFRHAEHRAKLVKENLRAARKMMAAMILTVGSIADRAANSVNPEDIHHLRNELDCLSGYQQVLQSIEVDTFLDGKMPALNLMEGTGKARLGKPVSPKKELEDGRR